MCPPMEAEARLRTTAVKDLRGEGQWDRSARMKIEMENSEETKHESDDTKGQRAACTRVQRGTP